MFRNKPSIILGACILACALTLAIFQTAQAAPAAPVWFILTQPDGATVFSARQWGDEWNHGFETAEGYTILQHTDGWWVYAEPQVGGQLGPALEDGKLRRVGIDLPEGLDLHLRPASLRENPNAVALAFDGGMPAPAYQNSGTQPVLVILAQYSNWPGIIPAANFAAEWFGAGDSIRDFYLETSFNQLTLAAAAETGGTVNDGVVGWVTLGATHPASDGSLTGTEMRQIAKDAVTAADAFVNYAAFDTNGDGYLSQKELHLFVIVAGFEASYDLSSPAVWAHNWSLEGIGCPTLDGKVIGNAAFDGGYSEAGELQGGHQATIGTLAHELGHDLSMPDLYDIDGGSSGVGEWSLMGSGNWNRTGINDPGTSPALLDAFLKSYQGWLTPTNIEGSVSNQVIAQAETAAIAFRLRPNPGGLDWEFSHHSGTGEYFLVENRQQTGYDAGLPGCGLLTWHIDETVSYGNDANADETAPLVGLAQADGDNDLENEVNRGDDSDPWPGTAGRYNFTDLTDPDSNLNDDSPSLVSIHIDSVSCSSSMQADLTYAVNTPGAFSKTIPVNAALDQATRVVLTWEEASEATNYAVCYDDIVNGSCSGVWNSTGGPNSATLSGLAVSTTYEWQVNSTNLGGTTYANGGVNAVWTFTTTSTASDEFLFIPVVTVPAHLPAAFGKLAPLNGATNVVTNPTFYWETSSEASSYDFCYDLTLDGECSGGWSSTGNSTEWTLSGLPANTSYEWQVRANNITGTVYADGGTEWGFTTGVNPGAPIVTNRSTFMAAVQDFTGLLLSQFIRRGFELRLN
jgi:M6 family metalloprotease-like protein